MEPTRQLVVDALTQRLATRGSLRPDPEHEDVLLFGAGPPLRLVVETAPLRVELWRRLEEAGTRWCVVVPTHLLTRASELARSSSLGQLSTLTYGRLPGGGFKFFGLAAVVGRERPRLDPDEETHPL